MVPQHSYGKLRVRVLSRLTLLVVAAGPGASAAASFAPGAASPHFHGGSLGTLGSEAIGRSGAAAKPRDGPGNDAWKMLQSYPRHYVARQLAAGKSLSVDGQLDDPAWQAASWSRDFVDITRHSDDPDLNVVPDDFQTSVKMLWDKDFLYIGANLKDPFVYGTLTGHNKGGMSVPYHNNDFEVFIDPSGTTEFYKEFEMNVLNATYDVNWGVPDNSGAACNSINPDSEDYHGHAWLPPCTNTTDPSYPGGSWTMWSGAPQLSGLRTATSYEAEDFGQYKHPHAEWSLEIAMPIRSGPGTPDGASQAHGGILSAAGGLDLLEFDPNAGGVVPGLPRYWYIDFARAEHPRAYFEKPGKGSPVLCPLDCSADLSSFNATLENPDSEQCALAQKESSTLLGADPVYGCYWEWVWQDLGEANAYMHRPTQWGVLQFAGASGSDSACRNPEHPARHVAQQLHIALKEMKTLSDRFSDEVSELLNTSYCSPKLNGCDLETLQTAAGLPSVFDMAITVTENAASLTRECTARPCYAATVKLTVPCSEEDSNKCGTPWVITASINENQYLRTTVSAGSSPAPCL